MGKLAVEGLGKAYRQYPSQWARLAEWILPGGPRHRLHWVLRDVSFRVEPGEAVAIIGANGAGKSTLLKLITGTTQPSEGRVAVEGRISAMLELGMGFHPDFSGRQNVFMAAQLLGMTREETAAAMPAIEAFADIGEYIDEPVRIYSSGMQVRLAFAVATARRPDILIVDEALSVGDARFQRKSFGRIRQFRESGTTLLLVSHDVGAVRTLCDRALWLDQGQIRAQGETRAVIEQYAASVYARDQDVEMAAGAAAGVTAEATLPQLLAARDCRQDFLNASNLRNDLEVPSFQRVDKRWGRGAARVRRVTLRDAADRPLAFALGGEPVRLVIEGEAVEDLQALSAGFEVKDRLGIVLFGDNTFVRYVDQPVALRKGEHFEARFEFLMPVLPRGHYDIAVALANGTQSEHVMEEWVEEALQFESHNAVAVQGVVGIPMRSISLGRSL